MGGGASKAQAKYAGSEAGIRKKSSRDIQRAAEELNAKLNGRGIHYENEEDEIRFLSALVTDDAGMNDNAPMRLQLSEEVRLTSTAAMRHIRREEDRRTNADPEALLEIIYISEDGARLQVKEEGATARGADPKFHSGIFWYKREELERPPESWTLAAKTERRAGVSDYNARSEERAQKTTEYEWAGRGARRGVEVEIDRLTCSKMPQVNLPWLPPPPSRIQLQ